MSGLISRTSRLLSYRHGYHAGNIADVLKHASLLACLDWMQRKAKPLRYIDTHAGAGHYALDHDFARKTGEAEAGYLALLRHPGVSAVDAARRLIEAVDNHHIAHPGHYPGSPALVAARLRDGDRADLYELHPSDCPALANWAQRTGANIGVHHSDGFKGLRACLPAAQKRALILIDPSYELVDDDRQLPAAIEAVAARQHNAVLIVWYPVVQRSRTKRLLQACEAAGMSSRLRVEWQSEDDSEARGMTSNGVLIFNPTYGLYEQLGALGEALVAAGLLQAWHGEDLSR